MLDVKGWVLDSKPTLPSYTALIRDIRVKAIGAFHSTRVLTTKVWTDALLCWQIRIRVIDEVEYFSAERQIVLLGDTEILELGHIHFDCSGTVAVCPARIAERKRRGLGERFRIEPLSELLIL